jgi:hypothetical protein
MGRRAFAPLASPRLASLRFRYDSTRTTDRICVQNPISRSLCEKNLGPLHGEARSAYVAAAPSWAPGLGLPESAAELVLEQADEAGAQLLGTEGLLHEVVGAGGDRGVSVGAGWILAEQQHRGTNAALRV